MGGITSSKKRADRVKGVLAAESYRFCNANGMNPNNKPDIVQDEFTMLTEEEQDVDVENPPFEFVPGMITESERAWIKNYCEENIGFDPSSKYFAYREKAIRYVYVVENQLRVLSQDYFNQPTQYNDFSGGLKRSYNLIPEWLVTGPLKRTIEKFMEYHKLPDRTLLLLQLQTTRPVPGAGFQDVTGQGIHTDGADRGMLLCFERTEVQGAENLFHANLDGSQPLCEPKVLNPCDGVFWKDNRIFHEVTDIAAPKGARNPSRTLLLIHSDAGYLLNGTTNKKNQLTSNAAKTGVQMRLLSPGRTTSIHPSLGVSPPCSPQLGPRRPEYQGVDSDAEYLGVDSGMESGMESDADSEGEVLPAGGFTQPKDSARLLKFRWPSRTQPPSKNTTS